MKANTSYNDFMGTAAADISDHINLKEFLISKGVDIERYDPIGANFYHGSADFFSGSIICIDLQKSTNTIPYIVQLSFESEFTRDDFFNFFKSFNIIVTKRNLYQEKEIDEEITIDNIY